MLIEGGEVGSDDLRIGVGGAWAHEEIESGASEWVHLWSQHREDVLPRQRLRVI